MTVTTTGSTALPIQAGDSPNARTPKARQGVPGPVPTSEGGGQPKAHSEMKSKVGRK